MEELSPAAQAVVRRHLAAAGAGAPGHASAAALTGLLPWGAPAAADYDLLAAESEYAAWTLVNGYRVNHMTVAVHRLSGLR